MDNKFTFLLVLMVFVSCGRDVDISTKQMKANANASELVREQDAVLKRGKPDQIKIDGTDYPVSMYSSHAALEFIAAKPLTTEMPVSYKGKLKKDELVLESIQAR